MLNKDALSYLVGLGEEMKFTVDGVVYAGNRPVERPKPEPIVARTLRAVREYLDSDVDCLEEVLVKVAGNQVSVEGPLQNPYTYKNRDTLMTVPMP